MVDLEFKVQEGLAEAILDTTSHPNSGHGHHANTLLCKSAFIHATVQACTKPCSRQERKSGRVKSSSLKAIQLAPTARKKSASPREALSFSLLPTPSGKCGWKPTWGGIADDHAAIKTWPYRAVRAMILTQEWHLMPPNCKAATLGKWTLHDAVMKVFHETAVSRL